MKGHNSCPLCSGLKPAFMKTCKKCLDAKSVLDAQTIKDSMKAHMVKMEDGTTKSMADLTTEISTKQAAKAAAQKKLAAELDAELDALDAELAAKLTAKEEQAALDSMGSECAINGHKMSFGTTKAGCVNCTYWYPMPPQSCSCTVIQDGEWCGVHGIKKSGFKWKCPGCQSATADAGSLCEFCQNSLDQAIHSPQVFQSASGSWCIAGGDGKQYSTKHQALTAAEAEAKFVYQDNQGYWRVKGLDNCPAFLTKSEAVELADQLAAPKTYMSKKGVLMKQSKKKKTVETTLKQALNDAVMLDGDLIHYEDKLDGAKMTPVQTMEMVNAIAYGMSSSKSPKWNPADYQQQPQPLTPAQKSTKGALGDAVLCPSCGGWKPPGTVTCSACAGVKEVPEAFCISCTVLLQAHEKSLCTSCEDQKFTPAQLALKTMCTHCNNKAEPGTNACAQCAEVIAWNAKPVGFNTCPGCNKIKKPTNVPLCVQCKAVAPLQDGLGPDKATYTIKFSDGEDEKALMNVEWCPSCGESHDIGACGVIKAIKAAQPKDCAVKQTCPAESKWPTGHRTFGKLTFAHIDTPDDCWRWAIVTGYFDSQNYGDVVMAFQPNFIPSEDDVMVMLVSLNAVR